MDDCPEEMESTGEYRRIQENTGEMEESKIQMADKWRIQMESTDEGYEQGKHRCRIQEST